MPSLKFNSHFSSSCFIFSCLKDKQKYQKTAMDSIALWKRSKIFSFFFNPCTAEYIICIFHSFKAGIANTIFSFKWSKKYVHLWKLTHCFYELSICHKQIVNFRGILFGLKLAWNCICLYTVLAWRGLTMEIKGFSHFEININVLASSFCYIWIPVLWVYDH